MEPECIPYRRRERTPRPREHAQAEQNVRARREDERGGGGRRCRRSAPQRNVGPDTAWRWRPPRCSTSRMMRCEISSIEARSPRHRAPEPAVCRSQPRRSRQARVAHVAAHPPNALAADLGQSLRVDRHDDLRRRDGELGRRSIPSRSGTFAVLPGSRGRSGSMSTCVTRRRGRCRLVQAGYAVVVLTANSIADIRQVRVVDGGALGLHRAAWPETRRRRSGDRAGHSNGAQPCGRACMLSLSSGSTSV